jgi:hypothetical protein
MWPGARDRVEPVDFARESKRLVEELRRMELGQPIMQAPAQHQAGGGYGGGQQAHQQQAAAQQQGGYGGALRMLLPCMHALLLCCVER